MAATVVLHGDDELRRKLDPAALAGVPARNFLNRWAIDVEGGAKENAPVWRGHLRRSLTHEVDSADLPMWAKAGTNLSPIAESMEFGTGLLSEAPDSKGGRHFPPPAALDAWAIDHGFRTGSRKAAQEDAAAAPGTYGLMVSQLIYRRGGLRPRRYLRTAAKDTESKIGGWLTQMAAEIEAGASHGAG